MQDYLYNGRKTVVGWLFNILSCTLSQKKMPPSRYFYV